MIFLCADLSRCARASSLAPNLVQGSHPKAAVTFPVQLTIREIKVFDVLPDIHFGKMEDRVNPRMGGLLPR